MILSSHINEDSLLDVSGGIDDKINEKVAYWLNTCISCFFSVVTIVMLAMVLKELRKINHNINNNDKTYIPANMSSVPSNHPTPITSISSPQKTDSISSETLTSSATFPSLHAPQTQINSKVSSLPNDESQNSSAISTANTQIRRGIIVLPPPSASGQVISYGDFQEITIKNFLMQEIHEQGERSRKGLIDKINGIIPSLNITVKMDDGTKVSSSSNQLQTLARKALSELEPQLPLQLTD